MMNLPVQPNLPAQTEDGRCQDPENGSGTVMVLAIMGALMLILSVVSLVLSGSITAAQTQRTADLAALAAADSARGLNSLSACEAAEEVATRNNAALVWCEDNSAEQGTADVSISISKTFSPLDRAPEAEPGAGILTLERTSRAGTP